MWFLGGRGAEVNGRLLLLSLSLFRQKAYSHSAESLLLDHHAWTLISKYHHSELFLVEAGMLLPDYHLGKEEDIVIHPICFFFPLWQMWSIHLLAWGWFCMCIFVLIMSSSRKLGRAEPLSVQNKT